MNYVRRALGRAGTYRVFRAELKTAVRRAVRRWGGALCQLAPLWLWRRILPEPILCLCYHIISDARVAHVKHYRFLGTAEFERDLQDLERRFRYITYDRIAEPRSKSERAPETSICLTFDDGFAECFSVARPILLRRGATCIFFVVTDLIDNRSIFWETKTSLCVDALARRSPEDLEGIARDLGLEPRLARAARDAMVPAEMARQWRKIEPRLRPLTMWLLTLPPSEAPLLDRLCHRLEVDPAAYVERVKPYFSTEQILRLRSDGFTIGAHGCSHRRLQDLPPAEAEREIVQSCRAIHELTGEASVPFAFPYFGGGVDRSWLATLRERHPFIGLFFDTQGLRRDAPFVVQRVFGERIEATGSIDGLLRRAWARRLL